MGRPPHSVPTLFRAAKLPGPIACGLVAWAFLAAAWPLPGQPVLEVSPDEPFETTGLVRGPFQPDRKVYALTNVSEVPLEWTTLKSAPWFSVSEPQGSLEPEAGTNVLVYPNSLAYDLEPGTYYGTLTFAVASAGKAWSGDVQLTVALPGPGRVETVFLQVTNQLELLLSGDQGSFYVLETANDLTEWTTVQTNVFSSETERRAVDLGDGSPQFFRATSLESNVTPVRLTITNAFAQDLTQLQLLGDPWGTYLVEASADSTNWVPIFTNKLPASGSMVFTNPLSGSHTGLSYRVETLSLFPLEPLHHVLIVGQSLAVGTRGAPVLSTTPSEIHYRFFNDGFQSFLFPLVEIGFETIASGAARHVTATTPSANHRIMLSNTGVPGAVYDQLKKGTEPYARGLRQFREAGAATALALFSYQPSAIFAVHGEGDHFNQEYDLDIRQWQEDYEADIRNVTGQDVTVPMFHSQASAWTTGISPFTVGPFRVLEESERHPDKTVLVCPKYFLPYSDGVHLTNTSYRWLGEYYGKAYKQMVVDGSLWTPLQPTAITREGTTITAVFHVPVPPLELDTNRVSQLEDGNYGFEFYDDSGAPPAIAAVNVTGPDSVAIELSAEPIGGNERLRYAYTGIVGNWGGPTTGPRGCLRDNDTSPSLYGNELFNWCVHFDKPVELSPP